MAKMMNVPILGVIENMSYLECPDCGKHIDVFGKSKASEIAEQLGVPVLATLPINPEVAEAVDAGNIEEINIVEVNRAFDKIAEEVQKV